MTALRPAAAATLFAAAVAALATVPVGTALSATQGGHISHGQVKGWSAVAGMSGREVLTMARTLPASPEAEADRPWCDKSAVVDEQLNQQFAETLVASGKGDTQLYGSSLMGTWTVVLARPDKTSCVIASGIGFEEGVNPGAFYQKVGLTL